MQELYAKVEAILDEHQQISEQAMIAMQALGYNGFKRLHRCDAKKYECLRLKLANGLFDKYRTKLKFKCSHVEYEPVSLRDHLATWDMKLEQSIKELAKLSKEFFDATGTINPVIKKALCLMTHHFEKTGRWYARFEDTNWLAHDVHVLDDRVHDKYKRKGE